MPDSPPVPVPAAAPPPAPEFARFRDKLAAGYAAHPPLAGLPVAERRRIAEQVRAPFAAGAPPMHDTRTLVLDHAGHRLRLRVHRPVLRPDAAMLYLHGGGWTLFSLDTHDRLMREYAARSGLAVIGLDYSLVPEIRFPVPVLEAVAAIRALRSPAHAAALGFDPSALPLAVGGDSAGGNLALAAVLALRDVADPAQGAAPSALLLNYAVVAPPDPALPSYALFDGPDYTLSAAEMHAFWDGYCPDPDARADPRASPIRGALRGLPPTLLHVAECDVLRDENLLLAAALRDAGVSARTVVWPGAVHSFLEAVSVAPLAGRALDDAAAWLRQTLVSPPS
ncbi:MAG: alpha/beta hydrolase [Gluconacetobacter diazotrophicus]|nr:alpha/beta hydrolase [Gluconacetobacter diazotrophicus]